jgi:hypothetical protein
MRCVRALLAIVLSAGCVSNSYRISGSELARMAQQDPVARARHVHVVQELGRSDTPSVERVDDSTQVTVRVDDATGGGGHVGGGGGHVHTGGGHIKTSGGFHFNFGSGGGGGGGKGMAIALVIIAATALFVIAATEAERFDGYADLHPMHPMHLVGPHGEYLGAMPLAWLDPATVAGVDHAVVKPYEGPIRLRGRAPLQRYGWGFGVLAGSGLLASADGSRAFGAATSIQLGYFFDNRVGIVGDLGFGWRDNTYANTLFETRYTAQLHAYPVVAGPLHLGVYAGGGGAARWEDGPPGGNVSGNALVGGALLQLELATRIALTARLGVTRTHGDDMGDAIVGLSVY